jgi:hypothetical protein
VYGISLSILSLAFGTFLSHHIYWRSVVVGNISMGVMSAAPAESVPALGTQHWARRYVNTIYLCSIVWCAIITHFQCIRIVCEHTVIMYGFIKLPPALSVDRTDENYGTGNMRVMWRIRSHLLHMEKVEIFGTESYYTNTWPFDIKLAFHKVQMSLGAINEVLFLN